jgi:hypothetical protein
MCYTIVAARLLGGRLIYGGWLSSAESAANSTDQATTSHTTEDAFSQITGKAWVIQTEARVRIYLHTRYLADCGLQSIGRAFNH